MFYNNLLTRSPWVNIKTKIMKNNILKSTILIAILGISLWACKKDEMNQSVSQNIEPSQLVSISPEQFGQLHNEYLSEAITNFNNGKTHKEAFVMLNLPELSEEKKSIIYDHYSSIPSEEMKTKTFSKFNSESSKSYYNRVELAIDNLVEYNSFINELNVIKNEISLDMQNNDKNVLFIYIETIKSSAYFWTPTELGGSGEGVLYSANATCPHCGGRITTDTDSWIKRDGRGAGYGMTVWGLTGLWGGPVGGGIGLVYGAISGAVVKSFLP